MSTQPFNSDGGFSTTGNITGNLFVGNGSGLTGVTASANTGNVTFSDQTVVGTGDQFGGSGLYLAPGTESVGNLQYVRVRGGDVATHIHIDTGNNVYFDQYFGNDSKYVKLEAAGNILIQSNDDSGNSAQWNFGTSGALTLPNGATIQDTAGNAVAFGRDAAATGPQGNAAVAIGQQAGDTSQGQSAVAIGMQAGLNTQGINAVAIGTNAGNNNQGGGAVSIGYHSGEIQQGTGAIAVGADAGANAQGNYAVAVGLQAGDDAQGTYAVAVGFSAGNTSQGINSVAIGRLAGNTSQANNSIILNATGSVLDQTTANTFTVAPVRNDVANTAQVMFYNTTSKEITYGNTISVAGNITGGNLTVGSGTITGGNVNGSNFNGNVAFSTGTVGGSGNITGGNLLFGSGVVSGTGNILGGNVLTGGLISATGNVSGGNLNVTGNIVDTGALSIITGSNGNIALAPNGTGIVTVSSAASVTGNITGGNLAILGNAATITSANYSIGYLNIPQVSFAANATIGLTDAGKHYYSTSASNLLLTIANNTSVSWTVGTAITIVNRGTANITIAQGTGVSLYLAGNSTSGNRTMTTYGMSTLMNVAANVWMINGTGVV